MTPLSGWLRGLTALPAALAVGWALFGAALPAFACDPAADACCDETAVAPVAAPDDHEAPGCPGDCDHCSLPCCSGAALAKLVPALTLHAHALHETDLPEPSGTVFLSRLAASELDHPPRA